MESGVQADILVCRTEHELNQSLREKLARFCNVNSDCVIQSVDVNTIYDVPNYMFREGLDKVALKKLNLEPKSSLMIGDWPERDVVGAKKIGMRTAFAVYGDTFGTKNSGADWDISDISQLTSIIREVNKIV